MTIKSSFFNSIGGDRVYEASTFASYFASFIGNGVFSNPSSSLQVVARSGNVLSASVSEGKGWINGYYLTNDEEFPLTIAIADGVLNRIDRVVMALNLGSRDINIYVKTGTLASSPVAPTLIRNGSVHELALADIRINANTTSITQSSITDLRGDRNLCGFVTGVIDQVDTTTLFNQYQTRFNEQEQAFEDATAQWLSTGQNQFDTWFNSVRNTLNEDVAGNLLGMIQNLSDTVERNDTNINQRVDEVNITSRNAQGYRQGLEEGTDILSLSAGYYEGVTLLNSPLPPGDNSFIEIDVTESLVSPRKQITITRSFSGEIWYRTIHTDGTPGSGSNGWIKNINSRDFADTSFLPLTLATGTGVTGDITYRRVMVNGVSTVYVIAAFRNLPSTPSVLRVATLPVGFRPIQVIRQYDSGATDTSNMNRHAIMQIATDGACFLVTSQAQANQTFTYHFIYLV